MYGLITRDKEERERVGVEEGERGAKFEIISGATWSENEQKEHVAGPRCTESGREQRDAVKFKKCRA